jgi:hypothetical protein
MTARSICIWTDHGRRIWSPSPRLRSLGFVETDLGAEDDWLTNIRAGNLNRDADAALKRDRNLRRTARHKAA